MLGVPGLRPPTDPPDRSDGLWEPTTAAARAAREELASGPMTVEQVRDALARRGHPMSPDDVGSMLHHEIPATMWFESAGETFVLAVDALLRDRVFTHRLTGAEIDRDELTVQPDLVPFSTLLGVPPWDRVRGGGRFDERDLDDANDSVSSVLDLLPGTLAGYRPDDLIGVSAGPSGLAIDPVSAVGDAPEEVVATIAGLLTVAGEPTPEDLDRLICRLCLLHPELFRAPLPPIADLLSGWGLDVRDEEVAPAGFDFDEWDDAFGGPPLQEAYGLTDDEAAAVHLLHHVFLDVSDLMLELEAALDDDDVEHPNAAAAAAERFAPGSPVFDHRGLHSLHEPEALRAVRALANPSAAIALFDETVGPGTLEAVALGTVVETLEQSAARRDRPALRWLGAKCRERLGEILAAEADFEEVVRLDPDHRPALLDLARYASDRGDAARAISLLRRAGMGNDNPWIADLEPLVPSPRPSVGRNDPCWCGSGRKYKRCHLGQSELTDHDRALWLIRKAYAYPEQGPASLLLVELADIRSRHQGSPKEAMEDAAVVDVALFDGGVLADFLRTRGVLLPEAEQLLVAQWLLVQRSVFEVEAVRPGAGVTLRDVRTNDRHEVADRQLSGSIRRGDMVCCRLLPVGDGVEIFSGVEPVPAHLQEATLAVLDAQGDEDADPLAMIEILSARFQPPTMVTGEGKPLVLCRAELDVPAAGLPNAVELLTEALGEPDDDGNGLRWARLVSADIGERVLSTVTLDDGALVVEASSADRFEEALAVVRAAAPDAVLRTETRTPAADLLRKGAPPGASPLGRGAERRGAPVPSDDPELAGIVEDYVLAYEARWLDMTVPALHGLTPRQAAVDPTRREDLVRLLDGFDAPDLPPGAMSAARLRATLGL